MNPDSEYELADGGDDRVGLEDLGDEIEDVDATDDLDDDLDDDADDADEADDAEDADDDEFDDLEDATDEDVDFVVACYREDGSPVAVTLTSDLANDLEELITQLRRLPGDAGSWAILSIAQEFFVLCRVRGRNVQVVLSDSFAAGEWPIARDIADFLGLEVPEDEEEAGPVGDLGIFADQGLSEFDLEQICGNLDEDADELAMHIAERIRFGAQVRKAVDALD